MSIPVSMRWTVSGPQVQAAELKSAGSTDALQRADVGFRENRSERLMAANDTFERLLESRVVERAFDTECGCSMINCCRWLEFVQQPSALLCERKRGGQRGVTIN